MTTDIDALTREVAERTKSEQRLDMLTRELSHQLKNTLAVVQAIARRPIEPGQTAEDFRERFLQRIRALAKAHEKLLATKWESADLGELVDMTLVVYGGAEDGRLEYGGPTIRLLPQHALCLSLVLHELGTNAAKYGALSLPDGKLAVRWSIDHKGDVPEATLSWREEQGPLIDPQAVATYGFGMQMIKQAAVYELDGSVDYDLRPEGLNVTIRFSLV